MYKELHIEYIDINSLVKPITVRYKLNNYPIVQKWASRLAEALDKQYPIDDPKRFVGFSDFYTDRENAVKDINTCCEIIDNYSPGFVNRRVDINNIDQDTLNYLHNIFETYHGTLNTPHQFFTDAPDEVKYALAKLNIEVHRCESFVEGNRKPLPRHTVTYFSMEKSKEYTYDIEDYQYFNDIVEFGTVYLLYTEIGKTLQDMAIDNDQHMQQSAYKPYRHYSADFVVRFYHTSHETWINNRKKYKKYYDANSSYFLNHGYDYSHPYNRPGDIPLAKIIPNPQILNIVDVISKRQCVSSVKLV